MDIWIINVFQQKSIILTIVLMKLILNLFIINLALLLVIQIMIKVNH